MLEVSGFTAAEIDCSHLRCRHVTPEVRGNDLGQVSGVDEVDDGRDPLRGEQIARVGRARVLASSGGHEDER